MNWTGGRLQRHSRNSAGKSLSYTQKQHFAKVRSRLQNGPRAVSPLNFSLLHAARDARQARESKREAPDGELEGRPKRQKTLSEYATTAALASRLKAMKPRQVTPGRGTSTGLQHGAKRPEPGSAANSSRAQYNALAGYRPSSAPEATARDQMDNRSNDGYEAGWRYKPESSRPNVFPTTLAGNRSAAKTESLEDKRQSLLQQDDWVGTAITRPLKISFPGANDRGKVGRRRRISTEERTRRILPIPRGFRPSIREGLLPQGSDWGDRAGREDISVRIGGQVHGSQRTILRGVKEVLSQSQHHSMSSDSMLFDREDTGYGAHGTVGLSPRTSLLGAHNQHMVHEDALWRSRTNSASFPVLSSSSGARFDRIRRKDELRSDMYHRVEDEEQQGHNNFSQSDDLYSDTERSQTSRQSSMQVLGQHHQTPIAEEQSTKDAPAEDCIEERDGFRGEADFISSQKCVPLTSRGPDAGPLRLIFDSTPQTTTTQLSDIGSTSNHNTQAIRSTMAEASDDTNDAVVKDSDEIEWEKLVMLGRSPNINAHSKSSLPKADTANKLIELGQTNNKVVTTPPPRIDGTAGYHSNFRLAANEQSLVAPVDEVFINHNARLQTEDEIWMKFLDISGNAEDEDQEKKTIAGCHSLRRLESSAEPEIPLSHSRPVNESILAQASSTSLAGTIVERPSPSSTHFASDRAHTHIERSMEQTSSLSPYSPIKSTVAPVDTSSTPFRSDPFISTAATLRTSSPDPPVATTPTAPSIAAATAHSSSSGWLLPSTSPAPPPRSDMRPPQQSQMSSPDPLTSTSPSAHVALHQKGQAATMGPPHPQRVLFTRPTPFTGRQVSATTTRNASREPLHLGRAIAGSSSKSKLGSKHAKATARTGMRKGRKMSGGVGRAAARSIYSIPSTNSDIEDGSGHEDVTESIEDDDIGLLEQI